MLAFGMPGPMELGIILLIVAILFGAGKLPTVLRDFGKGVKEFKAATRDIDEVHSMLESDMREATEPLRKHAHRRR